MHLRGQRDHHAVTARGVVDRGPTKFSITHVLTVCRDLGIVPAGLRLFRVRPQKLPRLVDKRVCVATAELDPVTTLASPLLKTWEVAERIKVCPETVLRWHRGGKLRAVRTPGGQLRFPEAWLAEDLESWATPDEECHQPRRNVAHAVGYAVSPTPTDEE